MSSSPDLSVRSRVGLSRAAVVDAALGVVSAEGLRALSLRRLASELGVTAPALYAHVRDKSDLLAAVAETGFRELLDRYAAITTDDPLERVRQQCSIYIDLAVSNPGLFQVMLTFRPGALAKPGASSELASATEAFEQPMRSIAEAIERGAIHPGHDPFVAGLTVWTATHGVAQVLSLGVIPSGAPRRALEESVIGVMLRGLGLPPAADAVSPAVR